MMKILKSKYLQMSLVMLIAFVLFFCLNLKTPLYCDDYDGMFSLMTGDRIDSVQDIIGSVKTYYYTWLGSVYFQFLWHLYLLIGKNIFNVINSLMFVLFGLLVDAHATGKNPTEKVGYLAAIYAALFILVPAFGQSCLWVCGANAYMHTTVYALAYLLPYRYCLNGQYKPNKAKNIVMFFVMLVLGFIVGESAPNVSVGVLFAVIAFITLQRINKKPVFPWMYGVGNFAGLIFILTAPGQHARAMATGESAISLKPISLLKHLILISSDLFRNYWMILILLAFFIYWIVRKWVENNHKASDILMASFAEIPEFWFYVFFFLAATFSMIVVSGFPARVWCSPTAGLIILTIVLVNYLVEHEMIANVKVTIVSCLIVLCALVIYPSAYTDVNSTFYYATKRDEYIQIQVEEGKSEIRAAPICSSSRYACFRAGGDLGADPNVWPNTSIARYYNVEALIGDISISYD